MGVKGSHGGIKNRTEGERRIERVKKSEQENYNYKVNVEGD